MEADGLGFVQAVTARKAAEKQTSGGLLAKLHYGVVELLGQAAGLLRDHLGDWNETSDKFRVSGGFSDGSLHGPHRK
jgi:hypothetical protein